MAKHPPLAKLITFLPKTPSTPCLIVCLGSYISTDHRVGFSMVATLCGAGAAMETRARAMETEMDSTAAATLTPACAVASFRPCFDSKILH
jgi:hypothetical protein